MTATARTQARDQIKAALTNPRRVCEQLGLLERAQRQPGGGVTILCPSSGHNEHSPSCSVTNGPDGTLRVKCFGCAFSGDVFHLVAAAERLDMGRDFTAVLDRAAALAAVDPTAAAPAPRLRAVRAPAPEPRADAAAFHRGARGLLALCPLVGSVAAGLAQRGVLPEAVADGWGELPVNASKAGTERASDVRAGFDIDAPALAGLVVALEAAALRAFVPWLWTAHGAVARPQHRLMIPWRAPDGRIWSVQRRYAPGDGCEAPTDGTPKYAEPSGPHASAAGPHAYGIDALATAEPNAEVWLCEGAVDVLALRALNARGYLRRDHLSRPLVALGLPGVGAWRRVRDSVLAAVSGRVVRLALDGDKAGASGVRAVADDCRAAGAASVTDKPPPAGAKDWAELTARYWKSDRW